MSQAPLPAPLPPLNTLDVARLCRVVPVVSTVCRMAAAAAEALEWREKEEEEEEEWSGTPRNIFSMRAVWGSIKTEEKGPQPPSGALPDPAATGVVSLFLNSLAAPMKPPSRILTCMNDRLRKNTAMVLSWERYLYQSCSCRECRDRGRIDRERNRKTEMVRVQVVAREIDGSGQRDIEIVAVVTKQGRIRRERGRSSTILCTMPCHVTSRR